MLSIVICDNEPITLAYYAEYLGQLMKKLKQPCSIDTYSDSGRLLTALYNGTRWNVYFLDIDMPLVGGLDLGRKLREFDRDCYLVYISIHREMVWDSMETRPFRFIPKDEFSSRIDACVQDILKDCRQEKNAHDLVLNTSGAILRFPISDIVYIQSMDKYVILFFADGTISNSIRYRLTDLEEKLTEHGFIRIHRSYLVNYQYIKGIHATEVILDTSAILPGLNAKDSSESRMDASRTSFQSRLPISRLRLDEIKSAFRRLTL